MLSNRMRAHHKRRRPKRPTPFGQLLLAALERRDLSQRQFSALVGEPQSMISRIIFGHRRPNPDWLANWSRVLGLADEETEAFIREGRTARLLGKKDSSKHAEELIDALRAAIAISSELVAILEDEGLQIPKDLKEGLGVLSSRWK